MTAMAIANPTSPIPTPAVEPVPVSRWKRRARVALEGTPIVAVHLAALGAIWTGVTPAAAMVCLVATLVRTFGITAGYHRYFAHRTFKTSRPFQFVLAVLSLSAGQRGVLWWAAHHRAHHKHTDEVGDPHSPRVRGVWYSHMGWLFDLESTATHLDRVKDLSRFPELRWLERFWYAPIVALAAVILAVWGWSGFFVGFCLSTVIVWQSTFLVNSLSHIVGTRRFETTDDSRNNWFVALLTFGEGWHNNHHAYQSSCRQGFRWWELDLTFYILKALSWVGLVWDLREPPARLLGKDKPSAGELDA